MSVFDMDGSLTNFMMSLIGRVTQGKATEEDSQVLLKAFDVESGPTLAQRMQRIGRRRASEDSILIAALKYQKDPRTIRRWCEKGYFPTAYQTKGGHWRIPIEYLRRSPLRPSGPIRLPKRLYGTKDYKRLRSLLQKVAKTAGIAAIFEMARRGIPMMALLKSKGKKISNKSLETALSVVQSLKDREAKLLAAADLIRGQTPKQKLSAGKLARFIGISRATLYRRYGSRVIQRAIGKGTWKYTSGKAPETKKAITDADEIAEMFSEFSSGDPEGFSGKQKKRLPRDER